MGQNAVMYGCGNAILRAGSFLLIPLYTYTLPMGEYGLLAAITATIQIFAIFIELGTRTAFVRFGPEYDERDRLGSVLGSTIVLNIIGGLVITGIATLFFPPFFARIFHTDDALTFLWLSCGVALTQSCYTNVMTYYRIRNEGLRFLTGSAACLVVLVVVNILFLFILREGVKGVLMAQMITYGGLWMVLLAAAVRKVGIGVSAELLRKLFKFGFPLIFAMSGDYISEVTVVYLLSHFTDLEQVALYSLGFKIAQISAILLIMPFQLAYEPFIYGNIHAPWIRAAISRLFTYLMLSFAFVALGIAFISRDLLALIAPANYSWSFVVILLILPGIAFRGVYYIGESLLNIRNRTIVTGGTVMGVTGVSMGLSYFLIPFWGIYGAVVMFNVTSVLTALSLIILGMKTFPIRLEKKRLVIAGILLSGFLAFVLSLKEANGYIYHTLIPMVGGLSISLLFWGNFFDHEEKMAITKGIKRAGLGRLVVKIGMLS